MPLRFTQRIIEHLSHDQYKPAPVKVIARDMRIGEEDREAFDRAVDMLADESRVILSEDGNVRLPSLGGIKDTDGVDEITGIFKLNQKGFGFILPEQRFREGDLFIPPGSAGGAISGDKVRARVFRAAGGRSKGRDQAGRSGYVGRIVEVIERGHEHFVGTLHQDGKNWFVEPDGRVLHDQVLIRDPHSKTPGKAKSGDKVVFELLRYPDEHHLAEGVITKILGEAGRPDVETQAVIAAHSLRTDFPDEVVNQARESSRSFDRESKGPWPDREDLTQKFIFTIDPPDAKDFDDAISLEFHPHRDEWVLGVHIADVSHFIEKGSALDEEARLRGNSVYLPRLVIPMLPEVLSNGVCSLQEGVPRFTKSVFITFDGKGKVISQRLSSTVISSAKRLTYLEAQALIDGHQQEARRHARTSTAYTEELIEHLQLSNKLAHILEKRRMRDGMIVLALPEVELVFDDDGHVIDAEPEDNSYTHKLIEMFMVEANEALARTFEDLGVPVLRRIHPEPSHGDMAELRLFAMAAQVSVPDEPTRRDLQAILEATKNTPAARAIHFAVLRTLTKATYSPALIGHFALASEHYSHYTSPIRRYPDLTLHRVMAAFLDLTENGKNVPGGKKRKELARLIMQDERALDDAELVELGRHCSETEVEAEQAERELREFLVLQFLHDKHLGDEFPAVITGMMSSGVFVSIDRFLIEGKVATKDLPGAGGRERQSVDAMKARGSAAATKPQKGKGDRWRSPAVEEVAPRRGGGGTGGGGADQWIIDPSIGRARASRSGAIIAVGDIVTVQIVAIDLASRHLDLIITKMPVRSVSETEARRHKGAREERNADVVGTRRGQVVRDAHGRKQVGKRSGFKQGRRGRKSR